MTKKSIGGRGGSLMFLKKKRLTSVEEAIAGAKDIIAEAYF